MWIVIKVFLITVAFPQSDFSPHIPVLYEEVAGVETVLKLREPASSVQRLQRDPGFFRRVFNQSFALFPPE